MTAFVKSKKIGQVSELSLIAKLVPEKVPMLRAVLAAAQKDPSPVFATIGTIHFARWVIFDNDTRLFFSSNFDGELDAYLSDFVNQMPAAMDAAFGACEGYPPGGCKENFDAFVDFVRKNQVPTDLFYAAYPDASVKAVLQALDVHEKVKDFVRKLR